MPLEPGEEPGDGIPDDMKEFIDSIQRGEPPAMSDAQLEEFKRGMTRAYDVGPVGKTTIIGPAGKPEPVR